MQPLAAPPANDLAPASTYLADFRPGEPDNSSFPRAQWLASVRRVLSHAPDDMFGYGDPRGARELRVALASYLGRARAVAADPARIVIFGGFAERADGAGRHVPPSRHRRRRRRGSGAPVPSRFLRRAGLVDSSEFPSTTWGCASTRSPAPARGPCSPLRLTSTRLGVALAPARRIALVEWARESGGWIIEDDYDGEFRYDRQPVGALQSLDPERVIYGGTASKSLGAGLHIAWLVVPDVLLEPLVGDEPAGESASRRSSNATLADFIVSGRLDRHIRQMRVHYRSRRDAVAATLRRSAPWMTLRGVSAGLHGTVTLDVRRAASARSSRSRSSDRSACTRCRPTSRTAPPKDSCSGTRRPAGHAFAGALVRLERLLSELPAQSG